MILNLPSFVHDLTQRREEKNHGIVPQLRSEIEHIPSSFCKSVSALRCSLFTIHYSLLSLFFVSQLLVGADYDPLLVSEKLEIKTTDLIVHDDTRQRDIPLRVYLPTETTACPVVLFSHGLGGSCEGSTFLGKHWAARGYVAVFLQHPGSDTSVWKNKPLGQRMSSMREAANVQNFMLRVRDVPVVLDQLQVWNQTEKHVLQRRLDMERVGMSGHSFGAVTTQAVSGQSATNIKMEATDTRIKAAVIFSPSSPHATDPKQAFSTVKIPWMLMTGTRDISSIGDADMTSRLAVYPALPPGGKYELVLDGAEHSVFTDRKLFFENDARNPNHHRVILALSTAFWDAWLCGNKDARNWLDGDGPSSVLEKKDRWQRK